MQLSLDQQQAVTDVYEYGQRYLVGEMGSGKTAVAVTAAIELLRDKAVNRVLVVAPLRVCETVWPTEMSKWGQGLKPGVCTGPPGERLNVVEDLSRRVICVNYENLRWLLDQDHGCDMLIVDEVTKLKAGGAVFKSLRKCLDLFEVRLVMTGTPVSENFQGLFYPMMIVDKGASLGRNKRKFLSTYFEQDYNGYDWTLVRQKELLLAFSDQITVLPTYTGSLPKLTVSHVKVSIPMGYYKRMARDMVNDDVTANNAAVLVNKLQQIACGFVYDDKGSTKYVHEEKANYYNRRPYERMILIYQYEEEKTRAYLSYPHAYSLDQLEAFKQNKNGVLIMHSKSGGHGIDLTCCSHMIFMSPLWSSDLTRQTIARIWRRGQTRECLVEVLIGRDTIEEEIVQREHDKRKWHEVLMSHLK